MFPPAISRRVRIALLPCLLLLFFTNVLSEKSRPARPIDLNVANLKELQELPGVGAVTAQRIIDLRQKSGRFKRVEDLLAVRGISAKKLDAMRPYVTVAAPPATAVKIANPSSVKKPPSAAQAGTK